MVLPLVTTISSYIQKLRCDAQGWIGSMVSRTIRNRRSQLRPLARQNFRSMPQRCTRCERSSHIKPALSAAESARNNPSPEQTGLKMLHKVDQNRKSIHRLQRMHIVLPSVGGETIWDIAGRREYISFTSKDYALVPTNECDSLTVCQCLQIRPLSKAIRPAILIIVDSRLRSFTYFPHGTRPRVSFA